MYFTGACGETLFCTIGSTHIDKKKKKKVCIGTVKKIAFNHAGNKFFTLFAYDGPSDPTTAAPEKKIGDKYTLHPFKLFLDSSQVAQFLRIIEGNLG